MESEYLCTLADVSVVAGDEHVLDNIQYNIRESVIETFISKDNSASKLLQVIGGFINADGGEVQYPMYSPSKKNLSKWIQYVPDDIVCYSDMKVKELEFNIFSKGLAEMKRTLEDAQIRSPRKAILTYINNQVGAQVSQGSQVAIVSDLSHFKVEGEIADTYGDRVMAGGKVIEVDRIGVQRVGDAKFVENAGGVGFLGGGHGYSENRFAKPKFLLGFY